MDEGESLWGEIMIVGVLLLCLPLFGAVPGGIKESEGGRNV